MAIFNMEDSSISEYLSENRSIKQASHMVDKAKGQEKEALANLGIKNGKDFYKADKIGRGIMKDNARSKSDAVLRQTAKIERSPQNAKKIEKAQDEVNKYSDRKVTDNERAAQAYLNKKAAKKYYGAVTGSELKRRGYDPKTGEKLREAAEYILSILDEMEYCD